MEFAEFKEFMLHSAAKHDAEIAILREMMKSLLSSVEKLADGHIRMQAEHEATEAEIRRTQAENRRAQEESREESRRLRAELAEMSRIVFGHLTDREAHSRL